MPANPPCCSSRLLSAIVVTSTALWLGALAHLLVIIPTLFTRFPKADSNVALQAAPAIFWVSERYTLVVAIVAVLGTLAWRLIGGCTPARRWVFRLLGVATLFLLVQLTVISPRMERARGADQPTFNKLHGVSNIQYLGQTLFVLAAMLTLPAAIRQVPKTRITELAPALSPGTASATQPA